MATCAVPDPTVEVHAVVDVAVRLTVREAVGVMSPLLTFTSQSS
jgi:hypothetical protein